MPVRHIAFPATEHATWHNGQISAASKSDRAQHTAVAESPQLLNVDHNVDLAHLEVAPDISGAVEEVAQLGETPGWHGAKQVQAEAAAADAHGLAPAGPAKVSGMQSAPALQKTRSDREREQPEQRVEPSMQDVLAVATRPLQPMSNAALISLQSGATQSFSFAQHPVGVTSGLAMPETETRGRQVHGGPALPENADEDGRDERADQGCVSNHLTALELADAVKRSCQPPEEQPNESYSAVLAQRHLSSAHPQGSSAMLQQAMQLQKSNPAGGIEVTRQQLMTAVEVLGAAEVILQDKQALASSYSLQNSLPGMGASAAAAEIQHMPASETPSMARQAQAEGLADPVVDKECALGAADALQALPQIVEPGGGATEESKALPMEETGHEDHHGQVGAVVDHGRALGIAARGLAEASDVEMGEAHSSEFESGSDDEAIPLGSSRLPLSLHSRLANAGSSQRCIPGHVQMPSSRTRCFCCASTACNSSQKHAVMICIAAPFSFLSTEQAPPERQHSCGLTAAGNAPGPSTSQGTDQEAGRLPSCQGGPGIQGRRVHPGPVSLAGQSPSPFMGHTHFLSACSSQDICASALLASWKHGSSHGSSLTDPCRLDARTPVPCCFRV